MSPNIQVEARLLCMSVGLGIVLAAVYGLLRLFRCVVRHGWFFVGLEDLCYWTFAGFAVFYLLYRENDGALRLYIIGSVLFSMLAGDRLLQSFFRKVLKKKGSCFRMKPGKQKK